MEVAVRRLAQDEGDTSLANRLHLAADLRVAAEQNLESHVALAQRILTWRQIGDAIGVSAQAAHERFRGAQLHGTAAAEALLDRVHDM
jgi:hypothetical protein